MDSTERIKNISIKISRLAALLEQLRIENGDLAKENTQLKEELSNQMKRISVLEQELDQKQEEWEAQEKNRADHSEELKKQVDLYIQEIDRCITWLQNE